MSKLGSIRISLQLAQTDHFQLFIIQKVQGIYGDLLKNYIPHYIKIVLSPFQGYILIYNIYTCL